MEVKINNWSLNLIVTEVHWPKWSLSFKQDLMSSAQKPSWTQLFESNSRTTKRSTLKVLKSQRIIRFIQNRVTMLYKRHQNKIGRPMMKSHKNTQKWVDTPIRNILKKKISQKQQLQWKTESKIISLKVTSKNITIYLLIMKKIELLNLSFLLSVKNQIPINLKVSIT